MNFNTNAPVCQNYDQVFSSVFFQSAVLELLGLAGGDFAGEEKVYRDALVATTKSAATEEQIGLTREILNSEFCTGQGGQGILDAVSFKNVNSEAQGRIFSLFHEEPPNGVENYGDSRQIGRVVKAVWERLLCNDTFDPTSMKTEEYADLHQKFPSPNPVSPGRSVLGPFLQKQFNLDTIGKITVERRSKEKPRFCDLDGVSTVCGGGLRNSEIVEFSGLVEGGDLGEVETG